MMQGVNKLKEEIARFEQEKTDELRRLEEFKAQETKKLKWVLGNTSKNIGSDS